MESVESVSGRESAFIGGYNPAFVARARARRMAEEKAARRAQRRHEVDQAVKAGIIPRRCKPDFLRIVTRICEALEVDPVDMFSQKRAMHVVFARHAVMYWTCRLSKRSTPQIGYLMGRDHTSILFGKRAYVEKRAAMGRTLRPVR